MKTEDILNDLEALEIVVPEFQREYVWSKEQAKQLMVSLFSEYPVGSLLVWKTDNPPEIKNDAINKEKPGLWKVLLDGQQRLTTLYLLIKGKIPPYYKEDEITHDPRNLYFNLKTGEFLYYMKSKMEGDPFWRKVVDCFNQDFDAFTLLEKINIEDSDERLQVGATINSNLNRLRAILKTENPIQEVPTTAEIDEAIDVFDRVNSKGTKLTDAELVLTHITGKWPQARREMKDKILQLESKEFFSSSDYQKNLDFFTRCIVVSMTQSALYSKNAKLKYENFSKDDYITHWRKVSKSMDHLVPILKQSALVSSTNDLSTTNVLVPIIAHLLKNNCQFAQGRKNGFLYWMFLALVWGRYSGQTDQRLDKDVYLAMNSQNPITDLVNEIEDQRGRIKVKPSDLQGRGSGHPIYKMLYIVTKHKKAIDWSNGGTIYDTIGDYYSIQSHHIFPQALLYRNGFDSENHLDKKRVNEIANRAFITRDANFEISDKEPSEYLSKIEEKYPGALAQQFIPTDTSLWKIERYDDFLAKRRELIADEINTFLQELRNETDKVEMRTNWQEIISQGENNFVEFKSSLRWDYKENQVNKVLEHVVAKTISGFLNAEGGTLLIGVDDDGNILGLEKDYATLGKKQNRDGFLLHIVQVINNYLGKEFNQYISIKIERVEEKDICIVEVSDSGTPAFIQYQGKEEFYIRASASTQPMGMKEANEYINLHWNNK
jgi:hypothetical protein